MKKAVLALLIAVVCISLSACGTTDSASNEKEILFDKYEDVIRMLENEEYDNTIAAIEAMKPAPTIEADSVQNNEINFENVSRKSLHQKKYTRMSISNNNNDSQSFDAKSRAKRRYQELHSANTINIQKRDFDGFNKFKELCPDEQDNDSDETN